ncbi:pentatricopeptide repeat domain-containing protein 3, mitochondrial [Morone saxatilis]|uniref:pentatricopeptide repeat domain-containing protein 3, mitochondrial n=1 Tax=Morone saxatilis TaxID=34816 RepID=UPI0015E22328|nr:pentatricopeptide repeat domain-containing protein 3, mitochondrial [Morone saxatilis]
MVSPSQKPSVCNNMATPGWHVGLYIQRNSRFLLKNLDQLSAHRRFGWTPALRQQAAEPNKESTETIVIPRKKTWSKEAVLEALASTVSRDPTAYPYQFQDDPYLYPRTSSEFRINSLAQESGRSAAKYFINTHPKFFTKDFAEPHIPCLMPENLSLRLEEVSEEALKERISLRRVRAAVDMYDHLLQAGTAVSMETTHDLLDLICIYCDSDPVQEGETQPTIDTEESGEEMKSKRKGRFPQWSNRSNNWSKDNNAHRIFNLLPERDTRCYSALIRGMVMHGAHETAFSMYTDLLNNRLNADIHIFNALILATPSVVKKEETWDRINKLLEQMNQQKVQPNLMTFNSALKALKQSGPTARTQAPYLLNEMKALGIAPSLSSYGHILGIFYKAAYSGSNTDLLQEIVSELKDTSFTCQDPDDVIFFTNAMKICVQFKDLTLAYEIYSLLEFGDNWKLLGDAHQQSVFYGRFFNLVCQMADIDTVMKWYRKLIPSRFYPNSIGLRNLLQAVQIDSRLDLVPSIWKGIRSVGHSNKINLVEEVVSLMAKEKHSPEVQESFAECALDIKKVFSGDTVKSNLEWTSVSLSNIIILLLRANKTQQAWDMLNLFKSRNIVPLVGLLDNFLTLCHSEDSPQKAVELVQLSAAFYLPATPRLAERALTLFELTEEQRAILSELKSAEESSD